MKWIPFLRKELINAIKKCKNISTPRPDKLFWRHFKRIIKDNTCLNKFINIANVCIDIDYWLLYFKISTTIIISKLNKKFYNSPKAYCPIILLNTISKLFEKVIGKRLQFLLISNNFIHSCQLDSLKQWSTIDAGIALTHFIHTGQVQNLTTSTLVFDITQFFPLLNYQLLLLILDKASFVPKVLFFFQNYLVDKKTKYLQNSFSSQIFNVDVGVGQESALFSILSVLYLFPILHIFEKRIKNLKILISILSFIDNGLFISQKKSLVVSNVSLFVVTMLCHLFLGNLD